MSFPALFRVHRRDVPAARVAHPAVPLVDEMNRMFDDFFRDFPVANAQPTFVPSLGIEETDDAFKVTAELPGLEDKDFELSVEEGIFTLRGEKHSEKSEKDEKAGWSRSERSFGRFERRIALPSEVEVEKSSATFKNGVLEVSLPKRAPTKPKAHTINVKAV